MALGGIVELLLGVKAEGEQLEDIATPLTADAVLAGDGGLAPVAAVALDREVAAIERALAEHGPTERRELARLVGARFWGPGRFARGTARGRAGRDGSARVSRTRYGPAG